MIMIMMVQSFRKQAGVKMSGGQGGKMGLGGEVVAPVGVQVAVGGTNTTPRLQCEYCRKDCTAFIDLLHSEVGHGVCKSDHVLCAECWRKHIQRFRQSEC
jgi:hypothetical protein